MPLSSFSLGRTFTHTHTPSLPDPKRAGPSQAALWGPASDQSRSRVPPLNPRPNEHKAPSACAPSAFGDKFGKSHPTPPPRSGPESASERAGSGTRPADNTPATPAFPAHAPAGPATTLSFPQVSIVPRAQGSVPPDGCRA